MYAPEDEKCNPSQKIIIKMLLYVVVVVPHSLLISLKFYLTFTQTRIRLYNAVLKLRKMKEKRGKYL